MFDDFYVEKTFKTSFFRFRSLSCAWFGPGPPNLSSPIRAEPAVHSFEGLCWYPIDTTVVLVMAATRLPYELAFTPLKMVMGDAAILKYAH